GRYDKLIGELSGNDIPAVGIAFGFDRMVEAAEYFDIISNKSQSNQVLVTIFNKELLGNSLNTANELRKNKIINNVYVDKS
ncbi:MAG TPA: histidine--tRNA ligase, partial [Patescibacteria group bacterium]